MDVHARQGVHERDVARHLVGAAGRGDVERATRAHQDAPDILVAEAELHLLEGSLDKERAEGVHDRAHPGERQSGADVDEQLLADPDVDDPVGVACFDLAEELAGDLGVDQRDRRVGLDEVAGGAGELGAGVHHFSSTWATTTLG